MPAPTTLPAVPKAGTVTLVDKDGSYQYVSPELAHDALEQGYKLASSQQIAENLQNIKAQRIDTTNATHAAETKQNLEDAWRGHGALGAGALGYITGMVPGGVGNSLLAKVAAKTSGADENFVKKLYADTEKAHPTAANVGEIAGFTGGVLTGEGIANAALKSAGIALKAAPTVIGRMSQTAARGALENAAFGAQHDINESLLEDKPLIAEHFIADRGMDMLIGGALGGALHGGIEALGAGKKQVSKWLGKKGDVNLLDDIANETALKASGYSVEKFGEKDAFKAGVKKFIGDELLNELPAHKATKTNLFELAEKKRITAGKEMESFMGEAGKVQKDLIAPHLEDIKALKQEIPSLGERLQKLESLPEIERLAREPEIAETRTALSDAVIQRENLKSVEAAQVQPANIINKLEELAQKYEAHPYIGSEWEGVSKKIRSEATTLGKQISPDWTVGELWEARSKYDVGVNRKAHAYRDLHAMPFEAKEAVRGAIEDEIRRVNDAIASASPTMAELPVKYKEGLRKYAILSELKEAGQRFSDSSQNASFRSVMKGALLGGFGGLAGGHGLAGAVLGAAVEPILEAQARERSALLVAKALKRISTIDMLRRSSAEGASSIEKIVKRRFFDTNEAFGLKVVKPVNIRPPRAILNANKGESDQDAFFRHTDDIKKLAQDPMEIQKRMALHVGIIHEDAPETGGLMMDHAVNAIQYLAHEARILGDGTDTHSPTAHLEERRVSDDAIRSYSYAAMGALYPKETIEAMLHGSAPKKSKDALRAVWPQMYKQTSDILLNGLGSKKTPLTQSQRRAVTAVTGIPASYSQQSKIVGFYQQIHAGIANQEEQHQAASQVRKTKDMQKPFETVMQSLAQK